MTDKSAPPFRILPRVTPENEHFWQGGAEGELCFLRCMPCREWIHPPAPLCPACHSRELVPEATSGKATLLTFTVNHQPWIPGFDPPYVVAIVEMPEQSGLRLTTNIVNCPIDTVQIGMAVKVVFESVGEGVYLPLFEPQETQERK